MEGSVSEGSNDLHLLIFISWFRSLPHRIQMGLRDQQKTAEGIVCHFRNEVIKSRC